MQQSNIRIIKDFREYFLKLRKNVEICDYEMSIISNMYREFNEYAIRNNYVNRELNDRSVRDILSCILRNQNIQNLSTDNDIKIRHQILQLHTDLFL